MNSRTCSIARLTGNSFRDSHGQKSGHSASSSSSGSVVRLRALVRAQTAHTGARRVDKGGHIYNCGEQDESIYVVESGRVKVCVPTESGKLCMLDLCSEGDMFGEAGFGAGTRMDMAVATRPTIVRRISQDALIAALQSREQLEAFTGYLASRVVEQQAIITEFVTTSSDRRLAATLLRLGRKLGHCSGTTWTIRERISRQELAEMVGTTRSRVGYFLKRFQDDGLVEMTDDSRLVVREPELTMFLQQG